MSDKQERKQRIDLLDHNTAVMSLDRDLLQRIEDGEETEADREELDRFTASLASALSQLAAVRLH